MAETPDQLPTPPHDNEPAAGGPADHPGNPLAGFVIKNGWLQQVKPGYQPALPAAEELAELAEHFRAVTDAISLARVLNAALELHRKQHPKGSPKTVSPGLLLYYAHHKKERYQTFQVPKRTRGQFRDIKAPEHGLRRIQRLLLLCLTAAFTTCDEAAHGFVPGRSVLTNAQTHAGRRFVLNLDLKDFFPSTRVGRVLKVLQLEPFDLPKEAAHLIANLCCDQGSLPQGAPTSPLLTNVVCVWLDRKLRALAKRHRCHYTRYADDITFSSQRPAFTAAFQAELNAVLVDEGYEQNPAKQRLQTPETRQEVTGVVVNERPNVPREFVQDIRFLLHVWQKHGYAAASKAMGQNYGGSKAHARYRGNIPKLEKVLAGKIAYLGMVRGKKGIVYASLYEQLQDLNGVTALHILEELTIIGLQVEFDKNQNL
ncbi:RNA-directed DNA polymerase [Hymenobacter sp. BT186]|uniref:RNA-directed DNA polymerase n=1 Tax=Hymenobacter telluris TaxID=2816474 RepID=A0A939F1Z0_9BACT|nr:reverse transcriptase domain-containing protein [Hymenobacter telluris]MBO0360862.1 RNA-directed DNA polymerase [Hymenobacter telluris]MBW3376891.1 reverse transcriptase family protein [Hymenobacter norwichensis]